MSKFQKAIQDIKKKREKVANDLAMYLTREVKLRAPVKSGHLRRNSGAEAEHEESKSKVFVGANGVEYARVVHEGFIVKNIKGQPYIRDSIEQNLGEIKKMISEGLKVDD
ncbi:MAG: hypothetical protein C6W54_11000 [Bacillaceae bacterium]|nr:MAG: hypothetical protein C6W54_11000 [Bacillaceae bacterium]